HGELAAHGAVVAGLLLGFLFGGHGHASDRVLGGDDAVDGAGEGELNGTAHLTAIDLGGHDGAEGADVVEVFAHPGAGLVALGLFGFLGIGAVGGVGAGVLVVEHGFFLHVDVVPIGLSFGELNEVADLALEHDVGGEALAGLGVEAGEVARVGVAVGIGVGGVEEIDEVVAVHDVGVVGLSWR